MWEEMPNRWQRHWTRLREAMEDGMRQQITRLGFVFTVTVVLVGFAAFGSGNNLLFLLFAALLATFLISGLVSRLGLAGLELQVLVPDHVSARRPITARLVVTNRKWLIPSFSIHLTGAPGSGLTEELYIPAIPGGAKIDERIELSFASRGIYRDKTFAFSSRFPFGFTHRRAQVRLEQEMLVYPCLDAQPGFEEMLSDVAGEIESRTRGTGSDFYRIRPYVASESARHVDWRATAHTGHLQVREFAREQDQAVTIFLDREIAPEDWTWFETAVEYCAFLVWQLNQRDVRLQFISQRYERRIPEDALVYDILKFLALVEPSSGVKPAVPDERTLQIAISSRPGQLPELGYAGAHVMSFDELQPAFAARAAGPDIPATSQDVHHGSGTSGSRGTRVRDGAPQGTNQTTTRSQPR